MNYRRANAIVKDLKQNPGNRYKYTELEIGLAVGTVNFRLQRQIEELERQQAKNRQSEDKDIVLKAMDEYSAKLERKQQEK